jgi:uncharacterized membrane protein YadS
LFVVAAFVNTWAPSIGWLSADLSHLGKAGLTVTLFLIGTGLNKATLKRVGVRPLVQGIVLWIAVGIASLALILTNWIHL